MSLLPNTTYYARVKSINATQESDYSDTVAITTLTGNSSINPLPASVPILYRTISFPNKAEVIYQLPDPNEYISEVKITLSTNSDYSNPIYNKLTYRVNSNTQKYVENNNTYLLLTVSNLTPNTTYYLRSSYSNRLSISSELSTSFSTNPVLRPPKALGATNLTSISATVNWQPIKEATSYLLDVATTENFSSLVVTALEVTNPSHTLNSLIENTVYYFRVRSKTSTSTSINTNVVSFSTLDNVQTEDDLSFILTSPVLRRTKDKNVDSITVELFPDANADSYIYDLSTSSSFATFISQNVSSVSNVIPLTNLTSNTVYYFRVKKRKTIDDRNNESLYATLVFTTLTSNILLNPPQLLNPTTIYSTGFVLNWVKRSYANRYYLQISNLLNFSNVIQAIYTGDIDTLTIDGLEANTTYYVRLYALNEDSSSVLSNVLPITTDNLLPDITLLTPTEITDSSVKLGWVTNAAYTYYSLSIYEENSKSTYLGNGFFFKRNLGNLNSYTVDLFLDNGKTYEYVITGHTVENDSKDSLTGSFSTRAKPPVISFSNDAIQWSIPLNRLDVSTDKDFKAIDQRFQSRTITSSDNKFSIATLLNSNTNYYIRGYQLENSIRGMYSNTLSTFNDYPLLLPPTVYKTHALIRWKKGNSEDYKIQIKRNISGTYTPIAGYSLPVYVGNVTEFIANNLLADTEYSVQIQHLQSDNTYSDLSLPVFFRTNRFSNVSEVTLDAGLSTFSAGSSDISYDRFTVTLPNTYTKYLVEESYRSDFIVLTRYLELVPGSHVLDAIENSDVYLRIYGISAVPTRTNTVSLTISTLDIPAYASITLSTPSISSVDILNPNEALISLTEVANSLGYTIEISEVNTFNYLVEGLGIVFITNTKALVSGLLPTKTYFVRAYAFETKALSGYSNIANLDTSP